jgi:phage-related protein
MKKPLEFLGSSRDDLAVMPRGIRHQLGLELLRIQHGSEARDFKPMPTVGAGACEIRARDATGAYRVIYVARFEATIYVLHAFQKKTQQTARRDIGLARIRYRMIGART